MSRCRIFLETIRMAVSSPRAVDIEEYTNWDTFGMMQQLDVVPELAHA